MTSLALLTYFLSFSDKTIQSCLVPLEQECAHWCASLRMNRCHLGCGETSSLGSPPSTLANQGINNIFGTKIECY